MMTPDEIKKVADLLGLVHIPSLIDPPTALNSSKACTELSRLQEQLRQWADGMEKAQ